jgi:hypothetical protein
MITMPGDLLHTFLRDGDACCVTICISDTLSDQQLVGQHISAFSDDIIFADSVSAAVTVVRPYTKMQRLVAIES